MFDLGEMIRLQSYIRPVTPSIAHQPAQPSVIHSLWLVDLLRGASRVTLLVGPLMREQRPDRARHLVGQSYTATFSGRRASNFSSHTGRSFARVITERAP